MKEKMTGYKIFRAILKPIYLFWYNPKIIGKENIPKEGSIVVAGNHIHIMDQCNVIISTKRCLHYMAKKEYFDNSKVAWFFKAAGCIPVDRSKKDEEATSHALEVLKAEEALGIFPEGTRNALKEERAKELYDYYFEESTMEFPEFYEKTKNNRTSFVNYLEELYQKKFISKEEFLDNIFDVDAFLKDLILNHRMTKEEYYDHILLPLKFGAVSLAHKTDSLIVPYAITGDYKFRSKNLTVRIGEPFAIEDDLEKANKRLQKEIRDLMMENENNSGK